MHLAVSRLSDWRWIRQLWLGTLGDSAGYVTPPEFMKLGSYCSAKVGRYLGKALAAIPPGHRLYFASKPRAGDRPQTESKRIDGEVLGTSLFDAVSRLGVRDDLLGYRDGKGFASLEVCIGRRPQDSLNQAANCRLLRRAYREARARYHAEILGPMWARLRAKWRRISE